MTTSLRRLIRSCWDRAVRLVTEHRQDYPTVTAATPRRLGGRRCLRRRLCWWRQPSRRRARQRRPHIWVVQDRAPEDDHSLDEPRPARGATQQRHHPPHPPRRDTQSRGQRAPAGQIGRSLAVAHRCHRHALDHPPRLPAIPTDGGQRSNNRLKSVPQPRRFCRFNVDVPASGGQLVQTGRRRQPCNVRQPRVGEVAGRAAPPRAAFPGHEPTGTTSPRTARRTATQSTDNGRATVRR